MSARRQDGEPGAPSAGASSPARRTRAPRGAALDAAPELLTKAGDLRKRLPVCAVQGSGVKPYKITICDGQWQCACRAWCTTVPRRDCKHIGPVKLAIQQWAERNGAGGSSGLHRFGVHYPESALATFLSQHFGADGPVDDLGHAFLALIPLVDSDAETTANAWRCALQMVYDANAEGQS